VILKVHRRAEAEIREAATWYENQRRDLGRQFLQAVRQAFELLERDPHQFAKLETTSQRDLFRRLFVAGFPYLIVYEIVETDVFVYAVAHASRRPNYWKRRKRERPQ
jgi:plasmid stabilization system protein ParE